MKYNGDLDIVRDNWAGLVRFMEPLARLSFLLASPLHPY